MGFFVKSVRGTAAFTATLLAQALVIATWLKSDIGFLWYNVIGCFGVLFSLVLERMLPRSAV